MKITVETKAPTNAKLKRLFGRVFRSYVQVARALKPAETALVRVWEEVRVPGGDAEPVLMGWGEVTGIRNGRYSCPRNLMHEW